MLFFPIIIPHIAQGDRKVTQPILKYLLMVAIQYSSTELINTQYRCDCTRFHAQVMSCCNLLSPVLQLSLNSRSARMSFSQAQRVFIVEHYLASRSYLTCQNEFRDTFPYSPVPNKWTISRLLNRFRDTGSMQKRNRSGRPSVLNDDNLDDIRQTLQRSGHFQN
jgi:hypothetical protein